MFLADQVFTWAEFKEAFHAYHIPVGLLDQKLSEFLVLTLGTHTVLQYAQLFNNLCQYTRYHVDTDQKKMDRFRRGLNTKLRDQLNPIRTTTYNELVNLDITQEDCILAHHADKKRKATTRPPIASAQRFRLVQTAPPRPSQQPPQPRRWIIRPP
jgi:hypothetical protein